MRRIPDLIFSLRNLASNSEELISKELNESQVLEFSKLKEEIRDNPNLDTRKLRLSSGLKEKIYSFIFSFTPSKSKFTLAQRNYLEITRLQAIANIIHGIGKSASSVAEIQKSIYSKSKKYKNTLGILNSTRFLTRWEADRGNKKKSLAYYNDCQEALIASSNEIKAEWYNSDLRYHFTKSKEITDSVREKATLYYEELSQIDEKYQTRVFNVNFLTVAIIYFESIFDYQSLCIFLEGNLKQFSNKFPGATGGIMMIRLYYINYLLRIKNVAEAYTQIEIGLEIEPPNSLRWFRLKELKMLYGLRAYNTELTVNIYNEIKAVRRYKTLSSVMRNRIELLWLHGCIYNALKAGQTDGVQLLKDIRLARYLNSIPELYVDKKGMNVSIIIIQLLYYIILKDLDKLDSRFEAIEKYLTRYMKSDPLYRSYSFIRMLLQVPKQNFHPVAVQRHAKKYIANLEAISFLESHHPIEIEVMEYEVLWEELLRFLEKRN